MPICRACSGRGGPQRHDLRCRASTLRARAPRCLLYRRLAAWGNYQAPLVEYVRRHHDALNRKPAAFLSVSLSAAGENPDDWEGLEQCVGRFLHATDWQPTAIHHVAGAIRYSHYDFFKRLALKFIASRRGQQTITSRDYDMTDYDDLKSFALAFLADRRTASDDASVDQRRD